MIEQALERNTEAVLRLVSLLEAGAKVEACVPSPTKAETSVDVVPEDAQVAATVITLPDLRAALESLSHSGKTKEAKAIIKHFGVARLPEVPIEQWPEMMAMIEAAL